MAVPGASTGLCACCWAALQASYRCQQAVEAGVRSAGAALPRQQSEATEGQACTAMPTRTTKSALLVRGSACQYWRAQAVLIELTLQLFSLLGLLVNVDFHCSTATCSHCWSGRQGGCLRSAHTGGTATTPVCAVQPPALQATTRHQQSSRAAPQEAVHWQL